MKKLFVNILRDTKVKAKGTRLKKRSWDGLKFFRPHFDLNSDMETPWISLTMTRARFTLPLVMNNHDVPCYRAN